MSKQVRLWLILAITSVFCTTVRAEVAYFGLEPDIVTNYIGTGSKKLGYVRVTVELMLEDVGQLEAAEHHSALLRATAIEIFGRQPEDMVKSLTGREQIRLLMLETMRELMAKETGTALVKDVIFTKYLYQG